MVMQKLRHPANLAHAVTAIVEAIGVEVCARAVEKSPRLVYCWADPDHDTKPTLRQGMVLDALWLASGRGRTAAEAPIASWYLAELDREATERGIAPSPLARLADVMARAGDLAEEVSGASGDGLLTGVERSRIAEEAAGLRDAATRIITDMTVPGARP